mmetsp:Transcript_28529/g.83973  ORF Transcript_28529/g.83973 Transcript_28529/m.83973 type:complete len:132 (-) Transcript_28529:1536-1931(-)
MFPISSGHCINHVVLQAMGIKSKTQLLEKSGNASLPEQRNGRSPASSFHFCTAIFLLRSRVSIFVAPILTRGRETFPNSRGGKKRSESNRIEPTPPPLVGARGEKKSVVLSPAHHLFVLTRTSACFPEPSR